MTKITSYKIYRGNETIVEVRLPKDVADFDPNLTNEQKKQILLRAVMMIAHNDKHKLQAGDIIHEDGNPMHTLTEEEMQTIVKQKSDNLMKEIEDDFDWTEINGLLTRLNACSRDEMTAILKQLPRWFRELIDEMFSVEFSEDNFEEEKKEYDAWRKSILEAPEMAEDLVVNTSKLKAWIKARNL